MCLQLVRRLRLQGGEGVLEDEDPALPKESDREIETSLNPTLCQRLGGTAEGPLRATELECSYRFEPEDGRRMSDIDRHKR